jgi:uncharacterized membrane protein
METKNLPSAATRLPAFFFDLLITLLLAIWFFGGVPFQGKILLKYAPDLRRSVGLLLLLGFYLRNTQPRLKAYFEYSVWITVFSRMLDFLRDSHHRYWVLGIWTGFGVLASILQAYALEVTQYDVGLFHQVLWSLGEGLGPWSSISRAGNFWMDHTALSLVTLVPFFKLMGGHPIFLPILQPILINGGLAALLYFVDHLPKGVDPPDNDALHTGPGFSFQQILGISTLIAILCFDSTWLNRGWGFHENTIAFFCSLWGFALLFCKTEPSLKFLLLTFFFLLTAALSKEILLLNFFLSFLLWSLYEPKAQLRLGLRVLSLLLLGGFFWFELQPHPANKNYFVRYYSYLGNGLVEFAKTLVTQPSLVLTAIGKESLQRYAWDISKYWLFLPLISAGLIRRFGKADPWERVPLLRSPWLWLVTLGPSLASCALSTYPPLRWIRFHYVMELWPLLFLLTLVGLARINSKALATFWGVWMFFQWTSSPLSDVVQYARLAETRAPIREQLLKIARTSPDASIAAIEEVGTWLASRKWISRYPDLELLPDECPAWWIVRDNQELDHPLLQARLKKCQALGFTLSPESPVRNQEWIFYELKR